MEDAIVFGVVKEVGLFESKGGMVCLAIGIASICVPAGEVVRTRLLISRIMVKRAGDRKVPKPATVMLEKLASLSGKETEVLSHWIESDPEAVKDFFAEALLGRCYWWRVRHQEKPAGSTTTTGMPAWTLVDPLTPEEAGAALRGGAL